MNACRVLLLTAVGWLLGHGDAQAHFLFVRIGPLAEAGRAAEVYFSEQAEAGDPRFILKIADTKLWLQSTPGDFEALKVQKAIDRLRAQVPASGSIAVIGACEYGVLARPKKTAFLLRHFPKAMAGTPEELNRLRPFDKVPLEVVATFAGETIHFVALREGKPLPKAEFHTVASDLKGEKLIADGNGRVTWKPARPGNYSIYTSFFSKASGTFGGKKYEEIRDFATLAFRWPLAPKEADPAAVALFEEAMAARARWERFPGFSADIRGKVDGRPFTGTVTVSAEGEVDLQLDDETVQSWVDDQLTSLVLHRGNGPRGKGEGKSVLRFADFDSDHPLGRLVAVEGGRFASSYRIKDRQILVVNRVLGNRQMTITVLDNERTAEGKFLPRSYIVQYWDAATGALQRSETVQERWQRVGTWDLPATHTVTAASGTGLSVRTFTLSKHVIANAK
ncbi:MAG TPA: DUF3386 family protein [Gemmataceae bacterium]|nr:DUF3386 family protein [Gemmataceae bacterium]